MCNGDDIQQLVLVTEDLTENNSTEIMILFIQTLALYKNHLLNYLLIMASSKVRIEYT